MDTTEALDMGIWAANTLAHPDGSTQEQFDNFDQVAEEVTQHLAVLRHRVKTSPTPSAKVKQIDSLMTLLKVDLQDLNLWLFVQSRFDEYSRESVEPEPGDMVFEGTAEEAYDALRAERFSLTDDRKWAEASYDHERDLTTDALTRLGFLVEEPDPEVKGFEYAATHVSKADGSDAMMVSQTPFVLVNEEAYAWVAEADEWVTI